MPVLVNYCVASQEGGKGHDDIFPAERGGRCFSSLRVGEFLERRRADGAWWHAGVQVSISA